MIAPLRPSDVANTLARAADSLGVPIPPTPDGGELTVGGITMRHRSDGTVAIFHASGEGGHFDAGEFSEAVGRFVSERL